MMRTNGGGFLDDVQSWFSNVPVVCGLAGGSQELPRSTHCGGSFEVPGPMGMASAVRGGASFASPVAPHSSSFVDEPYSLQLRRAKEDAEAELAEDLRRLADERRQGLLQLDSQLAEAIEELQLDTVSKVNERISQHKEALANLERAESNSTGWPMAWTKLEILKNGVGWNASEDSEDDTETEDEDADGEEKDSDEDAAASERSGLLGHLVSFLGTDDARASAEPESCEELRSGAGHSFSFESRRGVPSHQGFMPPPSQPPRRHAADPNAPRRIHANRPFPEVAYSEPSTYGGSSRSGGSFQPLR